MRHERFEQEGPIRLDLRLPSGTISLDSHDEPATTVELDATRDSEELREVIDSARIELRPHRDGHEVVVDVHRKRFKLFDFMGGEIMLRVFAPRADFKTTRGQKRLWTIAEQILPRTGKATWTHNQAIMELGALVCTARVAHCDRCPVRSFCKSGTATAHPNSER